MLRIVISCLIGFVVSALAGRVLIPMLRRMKAGQSIKEIGPTWHMSKQGTPTMGGLMFIIAAIVAVAALGWQDFAAGRFGGGFVLVFALVFGIIGYIDDYFKVKKHENTGLTAPQKFLLQLAAAILFTVLMRNFGYLTPDLYIPFFNVTLSVPWPLYMVFAAFVMVGCVNAVNITDGIDGLASGVTMPVMLFFTAVACWWEHYELGIFSAALLGGLLGFLIYNFHPAKVFMGDTGSLFLGGAVCGLAFALDIPLVLILVGIIYIAETLSDIIQVGYFKLTHGKRIFRMAPLHHHLEVGGWSEVKLFCVFTGITLVMCVLAFWGVMYR
uniref:phospho-N-acetylmuramoyl-pentapeptide- transferase n=1 Tax=uncultured Flavonifractor sp. TaxID=1193534 RepID=UPI0026255431|nr:phospho-N-acetylmuramoyl-pentapeptide-transferase [uncultured Flavonifractor sp.]